MIEDMELQRVQAFLTGAADEMVEFVQALSSAESPSRSSEDQRGVQAQVSDLLESLDFRVRLLKGREFGGAIFAVPRERQKHQPAQLLLGHTDTVWPLGTLATMPVVHDRDAGVLRGPGVFDMKGGLAVGLYALRALREVGLQPTVSPVVFFNADEEIGSPESERSIVRLARRVCRVLVLEPALGAEEGTIKTERRGVGQFQIRVIGKSAHSGLDPRKGASAIQELAVVIQALHSMKDLDAGLSVNVGEIRGGTRANVVAAEAQAVVDVRVKTMEQAAEISERIRSLDAVTPGTRLEISGAVDRPPMEFTPGNRALWAATEAAGRRLGVELTRGVSGGASDGNLTSPITATIDGLGAVGDGAHAAHEFLHTERLPERAGVVAQLLMLPAELPDQ